MNWLVRMGGRRQEEKVEERQREREVERKAENIKAFSSLCALIFIWNQLVPNHEDNTKQVFKNILSFSLSPHLPPSLPSIHMSGSAALCTV